MGIATQMIAWPGGICQASPTRASTWSGSTTATSVCRPTSTEPAHPDLTPCSGGETTPRRTSWPTWRRTPRPPRRPRPRAGAPGRAVDGRHDRPGGGDQPPRPGDQPDIDHVDARRERRRADAGGAGDSCCRRHPRAEAEAAELAVNTYRVIGSPAYPLNEGRLRMLGRGVVPAEQRPRRERPSVRGTHRLPGPSARRCARSDVPTLVMHGEEDPLIQVEGGHETAAAVPGARLLTFPGMGHDLPEELWPTFIGEITDHARRVRQGGVVKTPEELTRDQHAVIPILAAMGTRVIEAGDGRGVIELPGEPNVNHFGALYAGSLFTAAEVLGGLIPGNHVRLRGRAGRVRPAGEVGGDPVPAAGARRRAGAGPRWRPRTASGSRARR